MMSEQQKKSLMDAALQQAKRCLLLETRAP
jgi:hypothetical protein